MFVLPSIYSDFAVLYRRNGYLQVNFYSEGCRFKKTGGCTFCNFPGDYKLGLFEVYSVMNTALNEYGIEEILFGVQGSIFDMDEFDNSCLNLVMEMAFKSGYKRIGFETHYSFVTRNILDKINRYRNEYSPNTEVYIELGLETCVQKYIDRIGKKMNLQVLKKKIELIHSYNIDTVLNVLWGIPCLDFKENKDSFLKTVRFSLKTGSTVVAFPYNSIRRNEDSASIQDFAGMLYYNFSTSELEMIRTAWYGDRQLSGLNLTHKSPKGVDDSIVDLFDTYNMYSSGTYRQYLLSLLISGKKEKDSKYMY